MDGRHDEVVEDFCEDIGYQQDAHQQRDSCAPAEVVLVDSQIVEEYGYFSVQIIHDGDNLDMWSQIYVFSCSTSGCMCIFYMYRLGSLNAFINFKTNNRMSLKIVVLAKQVPDTRCVGKDAMNADGTINRAALPAIFNPEDLNALEQALRLKDTHPGSTVTMLTMGPGRAAEIIREGLYRGADNGYLLTDRAFAGADTLATSYALATAIRKIGEYDVIIGGRQAIDGDTAQVGPQVAEKLGLPQVTYVEEIEEVADGRIRVKRHIDGGVETVEAPLPIVLTVNGSAAPCRPRNAKLVMKYKRAMGGQEKAALAKEGKELPYADLYESRPYLNITEWSVADVDGDTAQCGLSGSPTKVKKIENIIFQAKESKTLSGSDADVENLIVELLANHTIG